MFVDVSIALIHIGEFYVCSISCFTFADSLCWWKFVFKPVGVFIYIFLNRGYFCGRLIFVGGITYGSYSAIQEWPL